MRRLWNINSFSNTHIKKVRFLYSFVKITYIYIYIKNLFKTVARFALVIKNLALKWINFFTKKKKKTQQLNNVFSL